jgi:hypothetical protein
LNQNINAKIELLKYIHEKMSTKLEEIDLYVQDVETTLSEIEFLIKTNSKQD